MRTKSYLRDTVNLHIEYRTKNERLSRKLAATFDSTSVNRITDHTAALRKTVCSL